MPAARHEAALLQSIDQPCRGRRVATPSVGERAHRGGLAWHEPRQGLQVARRDAQGSDLTEVPLVLVQNDVVQGLPERPSALIPRPGHRYPTKHTEEIYFD